MLIYSSTLLSEINLFNNLNGKITQKYFKQSIQNNSIDKVYHIIYS